MSCLWFQNSIDQAVSENKCKQSFISRFTIISATKTPGQSLSLMFVLRDMKHEDFYFDKRR